MGSLSRKLTRHLAWKRPKQVVAISEGVFLSKRLERAAKENGAADPLRFLEYLRKMRRGYDPAHDGPSKLMALVDAIGKFEVEETARRKAAAEAGKG